MMRYQVVKTYGHNEGWSCTFRQHLADSHCRFVHGYALGFELTFECLDLDARNWCIDFGDLKPVKNWLQDMFDHKMLVAEDDPARYLLEELAGKGVVDLRIVPAVGCEKFAELVYGQVSGFLLEKKYHPRVRLISARVSEHSGNSAVCLVNDGSLHHPDFLNTTLLPQAVGAPVVSMSEAKSRPYLPGPRPPNCRMRLQAEGNPYPKSGCAACGNGGLFGCIYRDE